MGRMLRMVVLSISALGLCACAGTPQRVSQAPPPVVGKPGLFVADGEYITRVEQMARRRGIDVQWVNPPTKRVASR